MFGVKRGIGAGLFASMFAVTMGHAKVTYPCNFSIRVSISAAMELPTPLARWLGEGDDG